MARKPRKTLSADFETLGAFEFRDSMAEIRDTYYVPAFPLMGPVFPAEDGPFVEAVAEETAALQAEYVKADDFARTKLSMISGVEFGYYFCVVFVSDAQCHAFLKHAGWLRHTDGETVHVNGVALAQELGIPLPEGYLAFATPQPKKG